jgi:signal transduction histidine kinase/CHASE3 domain sensor protein/CheY-like chemotaxis protein
VRSIIGRRANELVLTAVLLLVAVMALLTWDQFRVAHEARFWVRHSYQVIGAIKDIGSAVRRAESGQRGFLLTGDRDYLAPYDGAAERIAPLQRDLQHLTADNPVQQDRLRALAPLVQEKLAELARTIDLRRESGAEAALHILQGDLGRRLMGRIDALLDGLTSEEQRLLEARLADSDRVEAITRALALGGAAMAILLLGFAFSLLASARQRLVESEATQRSLAAQLRASLDSISQGVAVFDPACRLLRVNESLPTLVGMPADEARPGLPFDTLAEHLSKTFMAGAPFLEPEPQIQRGSGLREAIVYTRTSVSGDRSFEMRRTGMREGGFVLTIADISERVRTEAALRAAQRMQAMGQLTGGIAHDFNNLLAIVIGNLELATSDLEAGRPVARRLERAMWGAKRGGALTQQLLAFARKQPLAPRPTDLSRMLPEMAALLRRTLGERIELQVVDAAGLWPAMADATQVESAVLNLALNARDAMPEGGHLTIEVANKTMDDAYARQHADVTRGDYVMLAVSDTGTGMSPEIVARVFEPFFTTKGAGKGTGLGLAMVFGFAKQSGGHVSIYSEPGEGTTVRLYLPRAVGAVPVGQRLGRPADVPRGTATVLVVEDEAGVREVTTAILRDLGYRVLEAADGAEALRVFAENGAAVDLALLDVVLPGELNGDGVARKLCEARPELRTLFMSGYTENAVVHHGRLNDGVHLIGKPFQREDLARKVAEVLGLPPFKLASD